MEVMERGVEEMLLRISGKYGMCLSELRVVAHGGEVESHRVVVGEVESHRVVVGEVESHRVVVGEVESHRVVVGEVESDARVSVSYPSVVYQEEVASEWLFEEVVEECDEKEKMYDVLSLLCDELEMCESLSEMEVVWNRAMSVVAVSLCMSDGILREKYEDAAMRYGIFKDGYERRRGVSESKCEMTEIMSESDAGETMCEWEAKVLLSKLLERVSSCASLVEVDMLWSEVSACCVSVSNESEELSKMLQSLINEVCLKKESLRVESDASLSLMEESYEYVACAPTVEVVACVSTVEVVVPVAKAKVVKAKVVKEKVVKEKVVKEKPVKVVKEKVAVSRVVSAAAAASSEVEVVSSEVVSSEVVSAKVAKEKLVKEKVVKEKVAKEKVVKEKKVKVSKEKESVYRGGLFASLVSESMEVVEESKVEESDGEDESSSRCYIVSKKEAACAAVQKMSSELPKLNR